MTLKLAAFRSGTQCQFELLPRLVGEMKGGDGFDVEDEYTRFRRRQRIHRMHLVGYTVSGAIILIGMLLFWHWPHYPHGATTAFI